MDKNTFIDEDGRERPVPEHLKNSTYKNIAKRVKYRRDYQRRYYHEVIKKKDEGSQMPEGMSDDDFKTIAEGVKEVLPKEDSVGKIINAVEKYGPLVLKFVQGFAENMQARQAAQQQGQQQTGPRPPPGWEGLTPIQKLNKKYDGAGNETAFYRAGVSYDEYIATGQAAISYQPVPMERTAQGQRMAAQSRRVEQPEHIDSRTMRDLQRQAESERWDNQESGSMETAKEVPRKDGAPKTINEAIQRNEQQKPDSEAVLQEISQEMINDNQRYIDLVVAYFKTRDINSFEDDLKNIDGFIGKFKETFMPLLPIQAKMLIKKTPFEELEGILKDSDPNKYELIKKKKLTAKFKKLWTEIQNTL